MSTTPSTRAIRRPLAAAALAVGGLASLLAGTPAASAHADHLTATAPTSTTQPATGELAVATTSTVPGPSRLAIETTSTTTPAGVLVGNHGGDQIAGPTLIGGRGGAAAPSVECLVDFDDDLVLQYHIPDAAENTWMTAPWYQACYPGFSYPAVAVKFLNHGHFHLGYADPKIGPCSGDFYDWGRKQDPAPASSDEVGAWALTECVSDIDPITEPRTGIRNHEPGHLAQIVAYDDEGHQPFTLRTLQVVGDDVEVCHLPPGAWEAAGPGGSPWQCLTLGEGYWDLSNHVDNAIEVRVEYLGHGMLDNIGVDLLDG